MIPTDICMFHKAITTAEHATYNENTISPNHTTHEHEYNKNADTILSLKYFCQIWAIILYAS
jgi:hypothetical protein